MAKEKLKVQNHQCLQWKKRFHPISQEKKTDLLRPGACFNLQMADVHLTFLPLLSLLCLRRWARLYRIIVSYDWNNLAPQGPQALLANKGLAECCRDPRPQNQSTKTRMTRESTAHSWVPCFLFFTTLTFFVLHRTQHHCKCGTVFLAKRQMLQNPTTEFVGLSDQFPTTSIPEDGIGLRPRMSLHTDCTVRSELIEEPWQKSMTSLCHTLIHTADVPRHFCHMQSLSHGTNLFNLPTWCHKHRA